MVDIYIKKINFNSYIIKYNGLSAKYTGYNYNRAINEFCADYNLLNKKINVINLDNENINEREF